MTYRLGMLLCLVITAVLASEGEVTGATLGLLAAIACGLAMAEENLLKFRKSRRTL